jgi:hypothetical protein
MTLQRFFAVARQVLAVLGVVFGVLTQAIPAMHLPTAVSSVLVVAGGVILAIEHYVADPSTGTTGAVPTQSYAVVDPSTGTVATIVPSPVPTRMATRATKPHVAP